MAPERPRAPRPVWISDDPTVIHRVLAYLLDQRGLPLCDACLAREVKARVEEVRNAIVRLNATGHCEQGLWWCGRCSTKAYVTLVLAGPVETDQPQEPPRAS
jgi:hypothetical protein